MRDAIPIVVIFQIALINLEQHREKKQLHL